MTKHYVARHNGEIVGTRSTKDRTYTHAVLAQVNKEHSRKCAYEPSALVIKERTSTYNWYVTRLEHAHPVDKLDYSALDYRQQISWDEYHRIQAIVALGLEGHLAACRQRDIDNHETREFPVHVIGWCGRPDLARKLAKPEPWRDIVAIVEAEQVEKKPKK